MTRLRVSAEIVAGRLTLTVSQLGEYIRRTLQQDPVLHSIELRGEVSNVKLHQTGTLFFTMKDELAALNCVMYASDVEKLSSMPFDGMRAVVSGSVGLYVRGGQMQFYVSELQAQGVGVLYERLMALKAKLAAQGLFDPARKKPLPMCLDTIGVVSSPTGAVIHDIMNVAFRRDPQARILLCPVRVQGVGAADEVAAAIRLLDLLPQISAIIVARGGGSMEDLWTFNEEAVVRAVAACRAPVVSAVGHETDVTLCDLAADMRVPTPSAAAECVVPKRTQMQENIRALKLMMDHAMRMQLGRHENELALLCSKLDAMNPQSRFALYERRLAEGKMRLRSHMALRLAACDQGLAQRRRELELLSPYRVLSRGYAMIIRNGKPVRAAVQLKQDDCIALRFADGTASAVVQHIDISDQEERP